MESLSGGLSSATTYTLALSQLSTAIPYTGSIVSAIPGMVYARWIVATLFPSAHTVAVRAVFSVRFCLLSSSHWARGSVFLLFLFLVFFLHFNSRRNARCL